MVYLGVGPFPPGGAASQRQVRDLGCHKSWPAERRGILSGCSVESARQQTGEPLTYLGKLGKRLT